MCILERQHGNPAGSILQGTGMGSSWFYPDCGVFTLLPFLSFSIFLLYLQNVFLLSSFAKPFPLPDSASHPYLSSLSFSLLVSQVQMSNPSTPPRDVSAIVCERTVCVCVWESSQTVSVKIKVFVSACCINVSQIMCMHVTVSSSHLPHAASPSHLNTGSQPFPIKSEVS